MQTASILIKPASGQCNMRCDYCFYCDEAGKRAVSSYGLMTEETLKNVIRKTLPRTQRFYSLAFQGGEPTLRGLGFFRAAMEMLRRYNRNGARISLALQTNGVLIDEEWAAFFRENGFLIGLSADGTAALHDRYRHLNAGGSAFDAVVRAARILEKAQVPCNILTVVHRDTAAAVRGIYAAYRERGWRYLQFIPCLDPLGERRGQAPWSLTPQAYGRFLIDLFDLWYRDALQGKQPFIRRFDNWLGLLAGRPPEACEQCGVCGAQYIIEANGNVYPCDFYAVDAWLLGNFNADTLAQIDEKRQALGFSRRSQPMPDKCRACRWLALCRNGCYRSREGEPDGVNYFCESYQMFFGACGERMAKLIRTSRQDQRLRRTP